MSSLPSQPEPGRPPKRGLRAQLLAIAFFGLVLLALIALGSNGLPAPLAVLRVALGLPYALLVPGYVLQIAVFPRDADLDVPERLALSFGLSVAVVPLLLYILDRLPWGLRLWPIVVGEGAIIAVASVAAWLRWSCLLRHEPGRPAAGLNLKEWWAGQDRTNRVLYGLLAGLLLAAAVSATGIALLPKAGDHFTEFYTLGAAGLAEDYPRQATAGQPVTVTIGIANHEGFLVEYRLEVRTGSELLAGAGPVVLADGQVWEQPLAYALPQPGDDQAVEFLLFRDSSAEPYRRLELWIDVQRPQ